MTEQIKAAIKTPNMAGRVAISFFIFKQILIKNI